MSRVFAFLGPGRAMRRQSPVLRSLCHVLFFFAREHPGTLYERSVSVSPAPGSVPAVLSAIGQARLLHAGPSTGMPRLWLGLLAPQDKGLPLCTFPSFQMPPLRAEVSTVCLFFHPTSLHGTFSCSFGRKGVVRSVSSWLSCWENCPRGDIFLMCLMCWGR